MHETLFVESLDLRDDVDPIAGVGAEILPEADCSAGADTAIWKSSRVTYVHVVVRMPGAIA